MAPSAAKNDAETEEETGNKETGKQANRKTVLSSGNLGFRKIWDDVVGELEVTPLPCPHHDNRASPRDS